MSKILVNICHLCFGIFIVFVSDDSKLLQRYLVIPILLVCNHIHILNNVISGLTTEKSLDLHLVNKLTYV